MLAADSESDPVAVPAHVLSMTDEEGDIVDFRSYLQTLPADALWDILGHIDSERFPIRLEAARREISRRRLFFISPYTPLESRLRSIYGLAVAVSVVAAFLRAIGSVEVPLDPGHHLCWFNDIAVGAPPAARMVFPLACFGAFVGGIATLTGSLLAGWHFVHRKLRGDVLGMGIVAMCLVYAFLRIAATQ